MVTYRHVLTMTSTTGVPVATAPRLRRNYYPPPLPHVSNAQPMHHFEIVMIDTNEVSAHTSFMLVGSLKWITGVK